MKIMPEILDAIRKKPKLDGRLIIGDYFRHEREGFRMVCTGIRRELRGGRVVMHVELSECCQTNEPTSD